MYKFVYSNTHPKCPNLCGWFYELNLGDHESVLDLHARVTRKLFVDSGADPHQAHNLKQADANGGKVDERHFIDVLRHPVFLGARHLETLTRYWLNGHKVVYVNSAGGFFLPFEGQVISATQERADFFFPQTEPNPNEVIRASRYSDGTHWYLRSNTKRIFSAKHNTLEEARREALQYVPAERFFVDDPGKSLYRYTREGD